MEINRFRSLLEEHFINEDCKNKEEQKEKIILFIYQFLYVNENAANNIYQYFYEQYYYSKIPSAKKILLESYVDRGRTYILFNALFGRRVNDCLSRALAYVIGRSQHRDVEIGITDNGFYLAADKPFQPVSALELLKRENFREVLEQAVDRSEIINRRFRHCAARSLMILREYLGQKKNVGRMQVGSRILLSAVKRISNNFPILKEARREILEDLMDYSHAQEIIEGISAGRIKIEVSQNTLPSPFALGLVAEGYSDVIKIEDKQEFLKRMHEIIITKIALKEGKKILKEKEY
jgi:ATP-dependent Lhr-like helicase